jgi:hypothetical protein
MGPVLPCFKLHPTLRWPAANTCRCLRDLQSVSRLAIPLCLHSHAVYDSRWRCVNWSGSELVTLICIHGLLSFKDSSVCATYLEHEYSVLLYSSAAICVWYEVYKIGNDLRFEQAMCHYPLHQVHNHHCSYPVLWNNHCDSACDTSHISWMGLLLVTS